MDENLYQLVINKYGDENQILKAAEECSELAQALIKHIISPEGKEYVNIAEEMADVEIMLEQLSIILNNEDMVKAWKNNKHDRLRGLVTNA